MTTQIFTNWFKNNSSKFTLDVSSKVNNSKNNIFSSFLFSEDFAKNIISIPSNLIFGLSSFFNSLDLTNINIKITKETNAACTNGENIYIGFNLNKDNYTFKNANDKLDIYLGLLLHEACHCFYTDFSYLRNCKYNKTIKYIHNLIEDEMIERELGKSYPGYLKFIGKVKEFMFDDINVIDKFNNINNSNDFDNIMCLLFYIIRYPKYLNKINYDNIKKYENVFIIIKEIVETLCINDISSKNITKNSYSAAVRIYNVIKNYINEFDNADNQEYSSYTDENSGLNEISNKYDSFDHKNLDYKVISDEYVASDELINELKETFEVFVSKNNNLSKNPNYNIYYNAIHNYINNVKKILNSNNIVNKSIINRYKKSGSLDSSKLVSGLLGNNNIYKRPSIINEVKRNVLNVCILVDNSGSMANTYDVLANKIAILFYEGLKNNKDIKLSVYTHNEQIIKYYDDNINKIHSLGVHKSYGNQNEVETYSLIGNDLLKKMNKNEKTFVINITDSLYLSNDYNIKKVIDRYKTKNIYFGVVTLNPKNNFRNDSIYGNNYTEYNGDFNEMINKISKNIKNILREN